MTSTTRFLPLAGVLLGVALAGCGSSMTPPVAPAAKIEQVGSSSRIVLSAVGAQRIGVQTAPALTVPTPAGARARAGGSVSVANPTGSPGRPVAVIPFSAVVYDPSGHAYAFANVAPLTYTEVPIVVDHVSGNSAYLLKGPRPGTSVVTLGAEELLGVQSGVLAQT
jgi:hypothetical protein